MSVGHDDDDDGGFRTEGENNQATGSRWLDDMQTLRARTWADWGNEHDQ